MPEASRTIIVSPTARPKPSTDGGSDARQGRGEDDPEQGLRASRSERERGSPVRRGHGAERVLGDREDDGADCERQPGAGDERVEPVLGAEDALHPGRQHNESEEADDDRRDAGQKLDSRA